MNENEPVKLELSRGEWIWLLSVLRFDGHMTPGLRPDRSTSSLLSLERQLDEITKAADVKEKLESLHHETGVDERNRG